MTRVTEGTEGVDHHANAAYEYAARQEVEERVQGGAKGV